MAGQQKPPAFAFAKPGGKGSQPSFPKPPQRPGARGAKASSRAQAIPDAVANRMARRIAIATGVPSVMGIGVFVGSYLLVSRQILDVPPGVTLATSGGFFLLGLAGLSYGVLSSSWEPAPGSLLGIEQISLNIGRIRASIRGMRGNDASS
ncbi:MAG: PAM68 family protein [Cyanobacteriota bacterium]